MAEERPSKIARMTVENGLTHPTTKTVDELKKEIVKEKTVKHPDGGKDYIVPDSYEPVKPDYKHNARDGGKEKDGVVKFAKLVDHAIIPCRGSANAAGMDLHSAENVTIPAQSHGIVRTGLQIELPDYTYGRVAPRSSLAAKKFIDVGAGVIDADYRGEIGIVIFNHYKEDFVVKYGDRVAQLIIERIMMPVVVDATEEGLSGTQRGAGGFGSTGK